MDQIFDFVNKSENTIAVEIILGIIICSVIYSFVYIYGLVSGKVTEKKNDNPVLLSGLVNAKYSREIKQDPNISNSVTLKRSSNEDGIEYTYSLWIYINGDTWNVSSSNNDYWKHIFHKGPKIKSFTTSEPHLYSPIQGPGLWLSPDKNSLRMYVNTYETNKEFLDISNIPVNKWIHLVYTQSNFTSSVYINGRLKTVHNLYTLPRQNYYSVYTTENGGFNGYLSKMQYFNHVLHPSKIFDISRDGPSLKQNKDLYATSADNAHLQTDLPYLSNRWWVDDLTKN